MTIRLMHLADLHLGAPMSYLGDKALQRTSELESALYRALALAPEKGVHAVVIAGDLFDSFNPPADLVGRVKGEFRKVVDNGIPTVLIPGTHDSHRYAKCVYTNNEFPGVDIILDSSRPVRKDIDGQPVFFYGYSGARPGKENRSEFRRGAEDGIHIALAHGTVQEGDHWSTSPRDYALSPEDIEKSDFDFVALGHHHSFQEFRLGKTVAAYPGTLEGRKFGENGDRYLIIAEIGPNGVSIEKMKHNVRTVSEISIDLTSAGVASDSELADSIEKQADPDGIVRVVLMGAADFIPEKSEIESGLTDRFFYLEIVDETTICSSDRIETFKNENTVRGMFTRKMIEKIEQSSGADLTAAELALRLGIEQFLRMSDEDNRDFH